jgi:hypothetical protein
MSKIFLFSSSKKRDKTIDFFDSRIAKTANICNCSVSAAENYSRRDGSRATFFKNCLIFQHVKDFLKNVY